MTLTHRIRVQFPAWRGSAKVLQTPVSQRGFTFVCVCFFFFMCMPRTALLSDEPSEQPCHTAASASLFFSLFILILLIFLLLLHSCLAAPACVSPRPPHTHLTRVVCTLIMSHMSTLAAKCLQQVRTMHPERAQAHRRAHVFVSAEWRSSRVGLGMVLLGVV